jgi:hypothetical protein
LTKGWCRLANTLAIPTATGTTIMTIEIGTRRFTAAAMLADRSHRDTAP